jgi:hypothetical protein
MTIGGSNHPLNPLMYDPQDGGGSISKEELSDLMNLLGIKKTPVRVGGHSP